MIPEDEEAGDQGPARVVRAAFDLRAREEPEVLEVVLGRERGEPPDRGLLVQWSAIALGPEIAYWDILRAPSLEEQFVDDGRVRYFV